MSNSGLVTLQNPAQLSGNLFWDPYSSKVSLQVRHAQPRIRNVSLGNTSLAMKDYTYRADSTTSMRSRAQSGVGSHMQRSSPQTTPGRIPSKMVLPPGSPQKTKISSIPIGRSATFPRATRNVYSDPQCNTGLSRLHQSQNRDVLRKDDEETPRAIEGTFEGGGHEGDEDLDEEEGSDENDSDNEDENEEDTALPEARQSFILLPETNGLPQIVVHTVPQSHHNGPPSVAHSTPTGPSPPHSYHSPPPATHPPRITVSSTNSRIRLRHAHEGPYLPGPGGSSGDTAFTSSTEWGEGSEAGLSERRSIYSQGSNSSAARSIWLEQQIALREEEAERREEEARLKEEDARGLEMAARKAFAWVQNLEARVGKIHDAAMQADAHAKRMDAKIWEREAEVLRWQAEMAKREVEVAKREIAVQRSEQEMRRKEREARRKEEELLLKEDTVRNKEQEALRMEEVQQKKTEIKQSGGKLSKRRPAEDRSTAKDVVTSAWEKLKWRINRDPHAHKQNLVRTPAHKHNKFDGDDTGKASTGASVPATRSRVEQWLKTTLGEDQQEHRSASTTSSGPSSQ